MSRAESAGGAGRAPGAHGPRGFPSRLELTGGSPLRGEARVPGDKSVSHRALMIASLAEGTSTIRGLSPGDDVERTAAVLRALGADIADLHEPERPESDGAREHRLREGHLEGRHVRVVGDPGRLHEAPGVLDVGNSGTSIRLLAGFVAPFRWTSVFDGDASVSRRPMDRVGLPLRLMGAAVDGRGGSMLPPLTVRGGGLHGIDYSPPVPSAQVKSAVLLAGLGAEGETVVRERVTTRTHTEELLARAGASIAVDGEQAGQVIRLVGSHLTPLQLEVPGDPSHAAFWVVAACLVPRSEIVVRGVYTGPGRDGYLDVLRRMGADIELANRDGSTADVVARHSQLEATSVSGAEVPGVIDEIPVLAVAASGAKGVTTFRDASELRLKESDRLATTAAMLGAFGAAVEVRPDGLDVAGGERLRGATVDSQGDHRIAMSAAVAGTAADGDTLVTGWDAVATSYPHFGSVLTDLQGLGDRDA